MYSYVLYTVFSKNETEKGERVDSPFSLLRVTVSYSVNARTATVNTVLFVVVGFAINEMPVELL